VAKAEKDLSKKEQAVESKKSSKDTSANTKSNQTKNAKSEKAIKDAKKSLTAGKGDSVKTTKTKVDEKNTGLTAYEEQALQGATKSKGNKKLLIILLLLFGILIIVGVAIALFFVLRPEDETKAVVCEVTVLSYYVNSEDYIVIGTGDKFNFTEETQTTSSFTKDIEATISEIKDFAMTYMINNVSENSYSYTLDFTDFQFSNCNVIVKVNNGETYTIRDALKVVKISQFGDVILEIKISGINPPVFDENDIPGWESAMQDWAENTKCDGNINLTLEVE